MGSVQMDPRRSNTSVRPSGLTSRDIHEPSSTVMRRSRPGRRGSPSARRFASSESGSRATTSTSRIPEVPDPVVLWAATGAGWRPTVAANRVAIRARGRAKGRARCRARGRARGRASTRGRWSGLAARGVGSDGAGVGAASAGASRAADAGAGAGAGGAIGARGMTGQPGSGLAGRFRSLYRGWLTEATRSGSRAARVAVALSSPRTGLGASPGSLCRALCPASAGRARNVRRGAVAARSFL